MQVLRCILDVAGNDYVGAVLLPITVVLWPIYLLCVHILLSVTTAVCWSIGMLFLPKLSSYVA